MKVRQFFTHIALFVVAVALLSFQSAGQRGPLAGRNVNMVSGTQFPDGDPFLQRQNEVTLAVSSRNPQHLMAGGNDYRAVDIPGVGDFFLQGPTVADAWLGLFKSFDGGSSWKSALLPGFPQDTSPEGLTSPLKGFTTGSDGVVRAGTDGLFYYGGIVFNRDEKSKGILFISRFIDNNNKETGDPIKYLNTVIVARGSSGRFVDKPWMAVDIPRPGAFTCAIQTTQDGKVIKQAFPGGTIYYAYTEFVGNTNNNVNTRVVLTSSRDCGVTWSNPARITDGAPTLQGVTIAIDPERGYVYLAWRQIQTNRPDGRVDKPNAIFLSRSTDQGRTFSKPLEVAQIVPFDQQTNAPDEPFSRFRTRVFPTMTVDAAGRVYVAWSQYGVGNDGGARILVKSSPDGLNWAAEPAVVAESNPSARGHQIMPTLAFAGGKLMMTFYDFRNDLALLPGSPVPSSGNIVDPLISSGRPYLHTVDARVAQAEPGPSPAFISTQVSKYIFDIERVPGGQRAYRQLQYNPPNLRLFDQGHRPFMGDYIDLAASPSFVTERGQWKFNTASPSTVFHTAWADNRDVQPPTDYDWTKYTATGATAGKPSVFDPTIKQPEACSPSRTGMRNQNLYTSKVTPGLAVAIPGNSKPLGKIQRAYVVFVQNTNTPNHRNPLLSVKYFRLTIADKPAGTIASFLQFQQRDSIDVAIPARSSVARSVYITSTDPRATVGVRIQEIAAVGAPAPLPGGLQTETVLNPDILNPDILNPDILNPDILNPDILNAEVHNPDILNQVQIASVLNPDILNPDILNPDILNPDILNPDILNPDILNPDILNPDILNPDILNPDILNPDILNPDILNPDILNPSITDVKDLIWTVRNKGNTTSAFSFKNILNRQPEDFAFQLLIYKMTLTPASVDCQVKQTVHQELVVNILNPDILNPDILNPDILNPDILNATFHLGPNETAKIALRVVDLDKFDDKKVTIGGVPLPPGTTNQVVSTESIQIGDAEVNAAVVAHEVNTEDAANGITTPRASTARVTIVTQEVPSARVGQAYSALILADGGKPPYTWRLTSGAGGTPNSIGASGLVLNPGTGEILGTPTLAGTFTFSAEVRDDDSHTDERDLIVTVTPPLGTPSLAVVSQPHPCIDTVNPSTDCVVVTDVISPPVSVKAFSGSGVGVPGVVVTLNITNGPVGAILGGTLARITDANGVAVFSDLALNVAGSYRLTASAAGFTAGSTGDFNVVSSVAIVTASLPDGAQGSFYDQTLQATGGVGARSWTIIGPLPAGLSLNASTGRISGTPATVGLTNFVARVVDSGTPQHVDVRNLSINIAAVSSLVTFNNRTAFTTATGATSASGPIPNLGVLGGPGVSTTLNSVMFSIIAPSTQLAMGGTPDSSSVLPGNDIAISGSENLNFNFATPIHSFGFDLHEPTDAVACASTCVDSTFQINLFNGGSPVGSFQFNATDDIAAFVGVQSALAFNHAELRELVGGIDNEYFGQVYTDGPSFVSISAPQNSGTTGQALNVVRVSLKDSTGAVIPGVSITLSLQPNPHGGTLAGTTTRVTDLAGVAEFTDLQISRGGWDYEFLAQVAGGMLRLSSPVDVVGYRQDASLSSTRELLSATLLNNGKILLAGGFNLNDGFVATSELHQVNPNGVSTVTPTGNLVTPRGGHTATLLPSGRVLVTGGISDFLGLDSAEIYDPVAGTFAQTGSMSVMRFTGHTATLLSNGKVLVAGGSSLFGPTNSADIYDPALGTFTPIPTGMTSPRSSHTATRLPSGKVLLAGGDDTGLSMGTNTAELYDPIANTFTPISMNAARMFHSATLLSNGTVLLAGGTEDGATGIVNAEIYNPAAGPNGTFTITSSLLSPRAGHDGILLPNGKVLISGGAGPDLADFSPFDELYDPTTGTFSQTGSLAFGRNGDIATLASGVVVVAGGETTPVTEVFFPERTTN